MAEFYVAHLVPLPIKELIEIDLNLNTLSSQDVRL